jgi:hypothetical protein
MKPPIFSPPPQGSKPQQYLHLARMFRNAALGLPAYLTRLIQRIAAIRKRQLYNVLS